MIMVTATRRESTPPYGWVERRTFVEVKIDWTPDGLRRRATIIERNEDGKLVEAQRFDLDHDEADGPVALIARAFARLLRERGLDPMLPTHREG